MSVAREATCGSYRTLTLNSMIKWFEVVCLQTLRMSSRRDFGRMLDSESCDGNYGVGFYVHLPMRWPRTGGREIAEITACSHWCNLLTPAHSSRKINLKFQKKREAPKRRLRESAIHWTDLPGATACERQSCWLGWRRSYWKIKWRLREN